MEGLGLGGHLLIRRRFLYRAQQGAWKLEMELGELVLAAKYHDRYADLQIYVD